ncbi:MAG: STAS domain-containing protein [Acidimicrobiales bacterium]
MHLSAAAVEILHVSEAPQLQVSAAAETDNPGLGVLTFAGTMCTMTVPGAADAIAGWLARAAPDRLGVDLAGVDFIDGRGVSLLVEVQQRVHALGIAWSITDPGERAREVLDVCALLDQMGVEPVGP